MSGHWVFHGRDAGVAAGGRREGKAGAARLQKENGCTQAESGVRKKVRHSFPAAPGRIVGDGRV